MTEQQEVLAMLESEANQTWLAKRRRAAALIREQDWLIENLRAKVAALERDTLDALANDAAKSLPDAGMVCVCVEQNAGWVTATDWDGNDWDEPADMTMADKVRAAVEWVKAAEQKARVA